MKSPSEMTNEELADTMECVYADIETYEQVGGFIEEAAKRLRTMIEPTKTEFCVGWKGKTRIGANVEILTEYDGKFVGVAVFSNSGIIPLGWNLNGESVNGDKDSPNNLIPNVQEPEILWRVRGRTFGAMFISSRDVKVSYPNCETEKVEVRVVK